MKHLESRVLYSSTFAVQALINDSTSFTAYYYARRNMTDIVRDVVNTKKHAITAQITRDPHEDRN